MEDLPDKTGDAIRSLELGVPAHDVFLEDNSEPVIVNELDLLIAGAIGETRIKQHSSGRSQRHFRNR
jgi:hypothetical protein